MKDLKTLIQAREIQRLHALIQYCRINGLFGLAHSCEQLLAASLGVK